MFRPEPLDLILILILALLLFGPQRLPEISRAMGKAIRDFRSAVSGQDEDVPKPPEKPEGPSTEVPPEKPEGQA